MGDEELIDRFRVVFMCTGNQARSVMAEHYFRKITEGLPVQVESCGTMDTAGAPALPEALEAAARLGLDLGGHGSRCYTALNLSQMDLVIGFDQNHVATAVVEGGAPPDKTFKLLELARLLGQSGQPHISGSVVQTAKQAVAAAASLRTTGPSFTAGEEIDDPAGRKTGFFTRTADAIRGACDAIVEPLFDRGDSAPEAPSGRSTSSRIWD